MCNTATATPRPATRPTGTSPQSSPVREAATSKGSVQASDTRVGGGKRVTTRGWEGELIGAATQEWRGRLLASHRRLTHLQPLPVNTLVAILVMMRCVFIHPVAISIMVALHHVSILTFSFLSFLLPHIFQSISHSFTSGFAGS